MTKREKKVIIDRYVQVKNLTEWYKYKLSKDNSDAKEREYHEMRYHELDREALSLGGLASELGLWDAVWDAYWEQRIDRSVY